MSNKLDLKMFLDGYANVAKKAEKLGHEDLDGRKTELNDQIKFAEKKISEMKNMGHKEFEQKSKIYMEIIKNCEKEIQDIDKEKDERKKNPEKDQEIKDMYQAKSNIIENAQDAYNKAKSENENEIENIKKELDDKKAEKAQCENELKEMLDLEKKDPSRAKDSHYKEFLNKKIEALNTEIKALEPSVKKQIVQKEKEKQEINAEYRRFLLNVGKIDRNEELIPMAADIRKQDEAEKQKAEQSKYNKAWNDAIEENKRRDAARTTSDGVHNVENTQTESSDHVTEENGTTGQSTSVNAIGGEFNDNKLPEDIEINLGRKGTIIYDGEKYKIPRRALKEIGDLDMDDIIESIEKTGMKIEDREVLKKALNSKAIDYAVVKGVCSAKKLINESKSTILNKYFKDCLNASEYKDVENSCNIIYDLDDLSKAGGMDEFDKYDFIQRAKKAERFNVGMQMGEFKPTFLSKIVAKIKGINIKKLAEKNESVEIENASAVNVALDKKDDEAKDFIKGLRVDEKTNLGKNLENTELDESQLSEIKNVYAHQKNDQMRTSNSGEER